MNKQTLKSHECVMQQRLVNEYKDLKKQVAVVQITSVSYHGKLVDQTLFGFTSTFELSSYYIVIHTRVSCMMDGRAEG